MLNIAKLATMKFKNSDILYLSAISALGSFARNLRMVMMRMGGESKHLEIINRVVQFIPVLVVDNLGRAKTSSEEFFHDKAMFSDVITRIPTNPNPSISVADFYPSFPVRMIAKATLPLEGFGDIFLMLNRKRTTSEGFGHFQFSRICPWNSDIPRDLSLMRLGKFFSHMFWSFFAFVPRYIHNCTKYNIYAW